MTPAFVGWSSWRWSALAEMTVAFSDARKDRLDLSVVSRVHKCRLASGPQHWHHRRRRAHLYFTQGFESVALVQRDVPRIRRLQVRAASVAIAPLERILQ